jgi:hypothetical protein
MKLTTIARPTLCLTLVLAPALLACSSMSDDTPQPGSATTTGATGTLNAENVPADLRHLVPLAQRWGIGDDVDRNAAVDRATAAEQAELEQAISPVDARITAWLNSFGQQPMPDEAAAFMYMQLALEEMRAGTH